MQTGFKTIAGLALALLPVGAIFAADWPQYRGVNHDGATAETGLLKDWPKEGPKVLWKIPLGESFGTFAVSQGKAFCFMERGEKPQANDEAKPDGPPGKKKRLDGGSEVCAAFDADSGKELWVTPIGPTIFESQGGNGPRSTPTIDGGHVYVLSTFLKLACLNVSDGKEVWSHDLAKEFGGQLDTPGIRQWGSAASPVIDGDLIFVNGGGPGQALMGIDKKTGNVVWKGQDDGLTHTSPTPATILGTRQIIFFTKSGLVSVVPETGAVLWRYPFDKFNVATAISPVVAGEIVYCSAAYNVGGAACKITKAGDKFTATELWRTPGENMSHWSTPVYHDGYLYGLFGHKEPHVPLKCIELATGKEMWSKPGFGKGGTTLVDGDVLVQGDQGQLVLVEATPKAYTEIARAQPFTGKCWNAAVVSGGRIYTRSTTTGICLEVGGK